MQMLKKQESQIDDFIFQEQLLEKQKEQMIKDNKFLANMLIGEKKNTQLDDFLNQGNRDVKSLIITNQQKKKKLIIKEDVKNLFKGIQLNLRAAGKDLNKIFQAYFQHQKKLSLSQLIELLQDQTFQVQNYQDATKVARYLVEIDRPIQNLNHQFETEVIFSIFKTNIGNYNLYEKGQQLEMEHIIVQKIEPKKQYIENWIVDVYKKQECEEYALISWKQFDQLLQYMGIIFEKNEYSHIQLLNFQLSHLSIQVNLQNLLNYLFQENYCDECKKGNKNKDCIDCKGINPKSLYDKRKTVHFQQSINKIIQINKNLQLKKTKSKEI